MNVTEFSQVSLNTVNTSWLKPTPTLESSSVANGLSPPLQISHSVVPKLHLSTARLRLAGSSIHSGGTQGILSSKTGHKQKLVSAGNSNFGRHFNALTDNTSCISPYSFFQPLKLSRINCTISLCPLRLYTVLCASGVMKNRIKINKQNQSREFNAVPALADGYLLPSSGRIPE